MNRRTFAKVSAAGILAGSRSKSEAPPGIIRAYLTHAHLEGAVRPDQPNVNTRWTGPGSAAWKIDVPLGDEYEVALCYACAEPGAHLVLSRRKEQHRDEYPYHVRLLHGCAERL